ncbi:UTP--glucose-1-phosphate uridylyltransferase [Candidatus Dependentiae bacterium]|nr:MAG: UTP--glucose-1-phosphate uridylyltransferase [Candidatus Dependentiae bacterium]
MKIRAAIIPAAGIGTRFLPLTKAIPKEMIPLIDKPTIQHVVEEAIDAHLSDLFIVIGNNKQAIVDYFSSPYEHADLLKEKDKKRLKETLENRIAKATIRYLAQPKPLGLGHAILMARTVIEPNSYFSVLLPDDILVGTEPAIGTMAQLAKQNNAAVIAVQEIPQEKISAYGVISIAEQLNHDLYEVSCLVEKPKKENAPSNLAIVGRYILPHKIIAILDSMQGNSGELQLTDAIQKLIETGEKVLAYKIPHKRFDTGTPHGWLEAIGHFGLNDLR